MENWERRFNSVQPPDSSVPSHREELRKKLQSNHLPAGRGHRAVVSLSLAALMALVGLTAAYPGWAKNLWNTIVIQTITFRTADGHTVMVKKLPAEACSTVVCDSSSGMMIFQAGERRTISLEANIEKMSVTGESGEKMTITTPDCDKIWIVNGDTVDAKNLTFGSEILSEADPKTDETAGELPLAPETGDVRAVSTDADLGQNYPNPFNPTTQISFDLKESGHVALKVHDLMGREIATLLNGQTAAGHHTVTFDGTNLPSGYYVYTLQAAGHQVSKTMILAK